MGIYARDRGRFLGQLLGDLFVLVWLVAWWLISRAAHRAVLGVAGPARQTVGAAVQASEDLRRAGDQAAGVPGLGSQLRKPFDAASGSLSELVGAAQRQVAGVEHLAGWAGWLTFLLPVSVVLALWLPRRIRFFLRSREDQRVVDSGVDLSLFALRALASAPVRVLTAISADPVAAWRNGDATVISRLAEVELSRSGVRLPPDPS